MKIIIDTNWFLSFLIKDGENRLKLTSIFLNPNIDVIISDTLLLELTTKIKQSKFRKYFVEATGLEFAAALEERAANIKVTATVTVCRDAKDNYLLALARDAKADYIITGDEDLLILQQFESTKIVTLKDFIEVIT
jgi:uncharacterized protein